MATALITGATAGIGAAFARHLAARGHDLVLVARDQDRLDSIAHDLAQEFEIHTEVLPADLGNRDETQKVCDRLASTEQPIDVLVSNAGFGLHSSMVDTSTSIDEMAFDVMIRAVYLLGNAAARAMKARGKGLIINTGSSAAWLTTGNYSAIKAWVNNYSESLFCELKDTGVHVMCLAPGWVYTEFHQRAGLTSSKLPSYVWSSADVVVEQALNDAEKGVVMCVPTKRWTTAVWLAQHIAPRGVIRILSRKLTSSRKQH